MARNSCRDQGTASINVDLKQPNLPKLLAIWSVQTRILKQDTVKNNTINNGLFSAVICKARDLGYVL